MLSVEGLKKWGYVGVRSGKLHATDGRCLFVCGTDLADCEPEPNPAPVIMLVPTEKMAGLAEQVRCVKDLGLARLADLPWPPEGFGTVAGREDCETCHGSGLCPRCEEGDCPDCEGAGATAVEPEAWVVNIGEVRVNAAMLRKAIVAAGIDFATEAQVTLWDAPYGEPKDGTPTAVVLIGPDWRLICMGMRVYGTTPKASWPSVPPAIPPAEPIGGCGQEETSNKAASDNPAPGDGGRAFGGEA